jgi:hypothetical protein
MRKTSLLTILLIALAIATQAQTERKFIRQGNKYFESAMKDSKPDTIQFNKAEIEYRKAIEKKPDDPKWNFNLADALYKQKKFEESSEKFKDIADRTSDKIDKSRALHNMGNSLLMGNKLDESIEAYKQALRSNPKDLDTKYNLLWAMNKKKKQDQQKKNQDQNKDKNKDQKKDQNKDQNKNQNQQNKNQQKQNQNQNQQQNQQNQQNQNQQSKISKQNAEQMLQALENNEKKTQEKVKKVQALKAQTKNVEKDW